MGLVVAITRLPDQRKEEDILYIRQLRDAELPMFAHFRLWSNSWYQEQLVGALVFLYGMASAVHTALEFLAAERSRIERAAGQRAWCHAGDRIGRAQLDWAAAGADNAPDPHS